MIKIDWDAYVKDRMWFGWMYLRGSQYWIHMKVQSRFWVVVQAGKPGSHTEYD